MLDLCDYLWSVSSTFQKDAGLGSVLLADCGDYHFLRSLEPPKSLASPHLGLSMVCGALQCVPLPPDGLKIRGFYQIMSESHLACTMTVRTKVITNELLPRCSCCILPFFSK